jgi:tetratricopeptide (TPR) repeat protein
MQPKRPVVSGTRAVVITALAAVLCTSGSVRWQRNPMLERLAIADGHRAVEPRLSIDVPYAPFRAAQRTLERRVQMSSLAGTTYGGLARLLDGDTASAVDTLRRAGKANAIDLAAAHYMHGLQSGSLADFGRALDALGSVPASAATTFNRALILEQLSDSEAAAAEWEKYLALDDSSGWSNEARQHLAANSQPTAPQLWRLDKPRLIAAAESRDMKRLREIVMRYPLGTRQLVQFELLPAWAKACSRGDAPAAERALAAARSCASALEDRLLRDAVA